MSQVTVSISGRTYRIACGDGEEEHLTKLAALFDGKIEEMRGAFGEIGDMRLHVMAAITIADDLADARRRIGGLEKEIEKLKLIASVGSERSSEAEGKLAEAVHKTAERIERLARALNPVAGG